MENKNSIICIHKDTNCREMSTPFICISIVFNNDNQYLKILFRDLIKKIIIMNSTTLSFHVEFSFVVIVLQ